MYNNVVGCVVSSGGSGDGNGSVDDKAANRPQGIVKEYLPLEWLNCPLLVGGGVVDRWWWWG